MIAGLGFPAVPGTAPGVGGTAVILRINCPSVPEIVLFACVLPILLDYKPQWAGLCLF